MLPGYQATTGVGWLEHGGVYVDLRRPEHAHLKRPAEITTVDVFGNNIYKLVGEGMGLFAGGGAPSSSSSLTSSTLSATWWRAISRAASRLVLRLLSSWLPEPAERADPGGEPAGGFGAASRTSADAVLKTIIFFTTGATLY